MKLRTCAALLLTFFTLTACENFDETAGTARVTRIQRPKKAAPEPYPFGPRQQQPAVSTKPVPAAPPLAKPLPKPEPLVVKAAEPAPKPTENKPDAYPFGATQQQPAASTKPIPAETTVAKPLPEQAPVIKAPEPAPKPENRKPEAYPFGSTQLQPTVSSEPVPAAAEVAKPEPASKPIVKEPETHPVISQQQPTYSSSARKSRLPIAPPTADGRAKKRLYPLMPGQNRGLKVHMY